MGGVTKPPDMPTRVPGTVVALWGSMKHPPMATTDEQIKSLPDNATPRQIRSSSLGAATGPGLGEARRAALCLCAR